MNSHMDRIPTYALVIFSILSTVCAQFFSKRGSQFLGSWHSLINADLILCVFFYAISTTSYLFTLKRLPLSTAYPMYSVTYVLVLLMGYYYFGESLDSYKLIGILLIIVGVSFIALSASRIHS